MRRLPFLICAAACGLALAACRQQAAAPAEAPTLAPAGVMDSAAYPGTTTDAAVPAAGDATAYPGTSVMPVDIGGGAAGIRTFAIVPNESTVRYKVGEILFREGNRFNIAVGTTGAVEGMVKLDAANPSNSTIGPITVDISSFKTDSSRRDNAIRERFLESVKFPKATFTSTKIDGIPADAKEGQAVNLTVVGDLTVRETTRPATFQVTATLQGGTLNGLASTEFNMSDFGVTVPDIGGMLKAEDKTLIEFEFVAKEG